MSETKSVEEIKKEQEKLAEEEKQIDLERETRLKEIESKRAESIKELVKAMEAEREPDLQKVRDAVDVFVKKYALDSKEVIMNLAIETSPPSFRKQLRTAKKEMLTKKETTKGKRTQKIIPHADLSVNGTFNTKKALACIPFVNDMTANGVTAKSIEDKWGVNASTYRRTKLMCNTKIGDGIAGKVNTSL